MTIVIYQLNNETHWELSPAVMRELVRMLENRMGYSTGSILDIELANCRAALEAELQRLAPPADNSDLI
jgi:hypothetical protein